MMKKIIISVIIVACAVAEMAAQRTTTTRTAVGGRSSASANAVAEMTMLTLAVDDSVAVAKQEALVYNPHAISIKGFSKRLSARNETFFVTNNSRYHITHVTLRMRYSDMSGKVLHEKTVNVDCNVHPGETRQASIPSFDQQSQFYYYGSQKPYKSATPFSVAVHIVGYEIMVENPEK